MRVVYIPYSGHGVTILYHNFFTVRDAIQKAWILVSKRPGYLSAKGLAACLHATLIPAPTNAFLTLTVTTQLSTSTPLMNCGEHFSYFFFLMGVDIFNITIATSWENF